MLFLWFTHCERTALSWTFISPKAWLIFNVTVSVFVYSWSALRSLETWWSLLTLLLPSVFTSEPMSPIRLSSALQRLDSSRRLSFMPRRFVTIAVFDIPGLSHVRSIWWREVHSTFAFTLVCNVVLSILKYTSEIGLLDLNICCPCRWDTLQTGYSC